MKRASPSPSSFVLNGAGSTNSAGTPKRGPSARMPACGMVPGKNRADARVAEAARGLRFEDRRGIRAATGTEEDDVHRARVG